MVNEIKILTMDDYDDILNVWTLAGLPFKPNGRDSRELMSIEMDNPNCIFYGMYDRGKLVGIVIGNFDGRRGWINRLAIIPDYRGKNLGQLLIEKTEKFLYNIGAKVICVLIEDINYPSISTFQKAGYNCEDEIKYFTKRPGPEM
jgi:ribosomal protein S18 acetylase RimI-like enzyme